MTKGEQLDWLCRLRSDLVTWDMPPVWRKKFTEALNDAISEQKIGRCRDCKYFEYDSVANVDGIPLIVAHEICNKWGDGCKTREDGYCFLFEPKESDNRRCGNCKYFGEVLNDNMHSCNNDKSIFKACLETATGCEKFETQESEG